MNCCETEQVHRKCSHVTLVGNPSSWIQVGMCEGVFCQFVLLLIFKEFIDICRYRSSYLKQFWNYIDLAIIGVCKLGSPGWRIHLFFLRFLSSKYEKWKCGLILLTALNPPETTWWITIYFTNRSPALKAHFVARSSLEQVSIKCLMYRTPPLSPHEPEIQEFSQSFDQVIKAENAYNTYAAFLFLFVVLKVKDTSDLLLKRVMHFSPFMAHSLVLSGLRKKI